MSSLIGQFRRHLADLISPPEDGVGSPKSAAAAKRSELPLARIQEQLKAFLSAAPDGRRPSGQANLIGLDSIRRDLGSRWEREAEKIHLFTRKIIQRHLLPSDIVSAWKEDSYVIVFTTLGENEARIKCRLIANDITSALLGVQATASIDLQTAALRSDGTVTFEAMPSMERLLENVTELEDSVPDATPLAAIKSDPEPALAGNQDISNAPSDWRAQTVDDSPMAEPNWQPLKLPKPAKVSRSSDAELVSQLRYAYRPMWDHRRGVISIYRCVALSSPSAGNRVLQEAVLDISDPEQVVRIDIAMMEQVAAEMLLLRRIKSQVLLCLPVHFETVASPTARRHYLKKLSRSFDGEQLRLLVIEVVGVPDGVLNSRLMEISGALRPHCRVAIICVSWNITGIDAFAGTGFHAVGCSVLRSKLTELGIIQHISRLARAAEKHGLQSYVRGLHRRSLLSAALGANATYLEGDNVGGIVEHIAAIQNFSLLDIYQPLLQQA